MGKTKILIVEDEPLIAINIKKLVSNMGYSVVGVAYNGDKALDLLYSRKPDLVLLDIKIDGSRDGIDIATLINEKYQIPFIYITSFADKDTLSKAKKTIPGGYIVKPFDEKDLLTSIEIALFRNAYNQPKQLTKDRLNEKLNIRLTGKEFDVLLDILDGQTNGQIAAKHFVSENTIKSHIKSIYTKMGTHSKAETTKRVLSG